jgi:putative acetyltransferase
MFDAIHAIPSPYLPAQQRAWAPEPPQGNGWARALSSQHIAVLANSENAAQGFVTLTPDGLLDFAFIAPMWQRQGRLRPLMAMISNRARLQNLSSITTYASLSAQPGFAKLGFTLEHHEEVERHGEHLKRAKMTRIL